MTVLGREAFQNMESAAPTKEKSSASLGSSCIDTESSYNTLHGTEINKVMHQVREKFQNELTPSQLQKLQGCLELAVKQNSSAEHSSIHKKAVPSFNLSSEKGTHT